MVHLLSPAHTATAFPTFAPALIGFLVLLGMAHIDFFLGSSLATSSEQAALRTRLKSEAEQREKLAGANEKLLAELTLLRDQFQALTLSEHQYRHLFADSPLPMWIYDLRSFGFLAVNNEALKILGYTRDELMRLTALDIRPAGDVPAFRKHSELVNPPSRSKVVWRHLTRSKRTLHCHVYSLDLQFNGIPARLIYIEDVTAAKNRELEERHGVKMEAASDLAAGVAHHFNNALTPVIGYTSLLRTRIENPEAANQLRQLSNAATRIANLTGQLTVFGRGKAPDFAVLDLNTVLENAVPMLRRLVGSSFGVELACGSRIPPFSADSEMITRVLVNLVLNARDSMPQGGAITVTSGSIIPAGVGADVRPSVFFAVEDSGFGVPKDISARIFEPFFTTHESGAHTGLGLALAYSIVKQHHGSIDFKPRAEGGTTFTVTIPCT